MRDHCDRISLSWISIGEGAAMTTSSENEKLKPQVHKSCRALAVGLVKCLKDTPCVKDEKRSYKECALRPDVVTSSKCGDLRDTYLKCKREQVGLLVWERVSQNPEGVFRD